MKKYLALVLTLVLGLTACGVPAASPPPASAAQSAAAPVSETAADGTHTVTDVMDRTVTLPIDIERVVITFNIEEYLAVSGETGVDKLVGFSHAYWEGRREDAWTTYTTAFPQLAGLPDVGYNDNISVESILALRPDVVIMSGAVNYDLVQSQLANMEAAGVPVVFVNYHAQTLELHRDSTLLLGEVMGQQERAQKIVDFYEEQMAVVSDRIAALGADAPRPSVYMEFSRGVGTYGNSWADKMWGAMIPQCGGVNIAAGLSDGNQVDVSAEQVIAADPDVIIFAASPQTDISDNVALGYGADEALAKEHLAAYKDRDGWQHLSAVETDRMGALYHDLSRHIFDFAGAQFMAKLLQPELFEDVDPEANLRAFFEAFMPVELDGVWTVALS